MSHAKGNVAWLDGNEATARVAYRLNEVMAVYPITPASPMGEWVDAWASEGRPNLWGQVPQVVEMQSEGGAAGMVHGSLQAGALTTTFTASQGLLLMLPNLYKIAGELTAAVIHVASRTLATSSLSIFGDHSDVMAARGTGWGLLCSASVQECGDFAAIATAASMAGRVPILHSFDGFRTSHEIQRVELISDEVLRELVPEERVAAHRARGLTPDHPVLRGTSQNQDVAFQAREAVNPFQNALPTHVQAAMDQFETLTGRRYHLFDYQGHAAAERVIVLMGSGGTTAGSTAEALIGAGEKVGVLKVRLFRPFAAEALVAALPKSTRQIAVLDRCKEPGSQGEPLYLDVLAAVSEHWPSGHAPLVVGGRYGIASKDFTPAMVKAVFDNISEANPRRHFTVGIDDDVSQMSLSIDGHFDIEAEDTLRAVFLGLGSDGTVGANKNTLKIVGDATGLYGQGYFVYDSKKAGTITESHLRFSARPIEASHLIREAQLLACHQWDFLNQFDVLELVAPSGKLLLNAPWPIEQCWMQIPTRARQLIQRKKLRVFVVDAAAIAHQHNLGGRINTVMQAAFFAVSEVMPLQQAIVGMETTIRRSYENKGQQVINANLGAIGAVSSWLKELKVPAEQGSGSVIVKRPLAELPHSHALAKAWPELRGLLLSQFRRRGNELPVSALPCDGTYNTGTSQYEKRNIAEDIPVWEPDLCVQCNKCVMVCPHAVIRAKVAEPEQLRMAPSGFRSAPARLKQWSGKGFTIQVSGEDCTGCGLCVEVCPAREHGEQHRRALNMSPQRPLRRQSRKHWEYFLKMEEVDRETLNLKHINQQQLQQPLFEFPGACAGCGETPYLKLVSQLFGDRMVIANATGCSSIYGGNLPTTPWSINRDGRGPAWSNSLFEDNAEFGLGLRVAIDQRRRRAEQLVVAVGENLPGELQRELLSAEQREETEIYEQRERVKTLKTVLQNRLRRSDVGEEEASLLLELLTLSDDLVKRSVWIVGGDGWAYDIGFGGLDHVLASQHDVNILVLDTEVYSNTGGQMSKATPKGAVAKFASGGKATGKKDLGLMAMTYGHVYVASVAMGARDEHTLRVFLEAESYNGPSLILAYSHCIAHGINMANGMAQQKQAVEGGRWMLYRHDPRRKEKGLPALQVDSKKPSLSLEDSMANENRFCMLLDSQPQQADRLRREAEQEIEQRWELYERLSGVNKPGR